MKVIVMRTPQGITRVVQPAGMWRPRPLRWRHGFALRLPRRRLLLVTFGSGAV